VIKDDEIWFFFVCKCCLKRAGKWEEGITARELIETLGFPMAPKRAWYLLEKWTGSGWYNYGVSVDMGWMEREAFEVDIVGGKLIKHGEK